MRVGITRLWPSGRNRLPNEAVYHLTSTVRHRAESRRFRRSGRN